MSLVYFFFVCVHLILVLSFLLLLGMDVKETGREREREQGGREGERERAGRQGEREREQGGREGDVHAESACEYG